MPRIPTRMPLPQLAADEVTREQQELTTSELQAELQATGDVVGASVAEYAPGASRRRSAVRVRNAVAWPLRPDGRDSATTGRRNTAAYAELPPLDPALAAPVAHAELQPLLRRLRAEHEGIGMVDAGSLLRLGVEPHTLQHVDTTLLRRLLLGLTTYHPSVAFTEDVRRAVGHSARRNIWSAHRDVERLYAAATKMAGGGPAAAFFTQWQKLATQLHADANATLAAEREGLPMLRGEDEVWHHCLETLRPYELAVAQAAHEGAPLDGRVTLDLIASLYAMRDIFDDWLVDAERRGDLVPPHAHRELPPYRR